MSRIIDRFHRIDEWMQQAPISLIMLGTFVGTLAFMALMVAVIVAISR